MKSLLFTLAALVVLAVPAAPAAAASPTDFVRHLLDEAMTVQNRPQLQGPEHRQERRAAIEKIIAANFDREAMAEQALGPTWQKVPPAQRREFRELFQDLFLDSYTRLVLDYLHRETVLYRGEEGTGDRARVATTLRRPNEEIPVDYTLQREKAGWQVVDVTIDGVSIVDNYRRSFARVIDRQSFADPAGKNAAAAAEPAMTAPAAARIALYWRLWRLFRESPGYYLYLLRRPAAARVRESLCRGRPPAAGRFFPSRLNLRLLYGCNLRCRMCGQWGETGAYHGYPAARRQALLEVETIDRVLAELVPQGLRLVDMEGGETLLYPRFGELLALLRRRRLHVKFATNGTLLDRHAETIVAAGVRSVTVSLDGDREVHDRIRGLPGLTIAPWRDCGRWRPPGGGCGAPARWCRWPSPPAGTTAPPPWPPSAATCGGGGWRTWWRSS